MLDGYNAMQNWIAKLRELSDSPKEIAADIAPELRKELEANVAAARCADGTSWKPTLAGHKPLQGARRGLGVAAVGTTVIAALHGIHARHHFGRVRGKVSRPILPSAKLSVQIVELVTRVASRRFRRLMGGA
jgi:hypothetical protein